MFYVNLVKSCEQFFLGHGDPRVITEIFQPLNEKLEGFCVLEVNVKVVTITELPLIISSPSVECHAARFS